MDKEKVTAWIGVIVASLGLYRAIQKLRELHRHENT